LSNSKAQLTRSIPQLLRELEIKERKLAGEDRINFTGINSTSTPAGGSGRRSDDPNVTPLASFLRTAGDTMIGAIAFYPTAVTISSGAIDITQDTTSKFSTYVIVSGEGAADDTLATITGAAFAGQIMYIQPILTNEITFTETGGNLILPDGGTDIVANSAKDGRTILKFIFDVTVNSNKWTLVSFSETIGANKQLSNLSGTVAVNVDLDPGGAGGTRDMGNPTQFWDAIFLERIRFPDTQALASGSEPTIGYDTGLAPDAGFWNVPAGNDILLKFDAVTGFTFNAAGLIVVGTAGVTAEEFFVNSAGADPTLNGEIVRNVADVKVFSGGAVRNMSDIGSGASGANQQLSNLSGTVAVNVDLDPGGAGGIRDIGNATQFWNKIFLETIRFPDTQTLSSGGEVTIGYDTGLAPDAAFWNVPAGNDILLKFDAVTGFTFNAAGLIVVGTAGVTAEEFFVNSAGADPTLNGEIVRNVADVKVFSGSAVRNFTQMAELDKTQTFTNDNTFTNIEAVEFRSVAQPTTVRFKMSATGIVAQIGSTGDSFDIDTGGINRFAVDENGTIINNSLTMLGEINMSLGNRFIDWLELSTPATPATNHARLFFDSADEVLKIKKSGGSVVSLEGGGIDEGTSPVNWTGTHTWTGICSFNGATTSINSSTIVIGDSSADNVSIGGRITNDFIPDADNTYDLGSATLAWDRLYLGDATTSRLRIPVGNNLFD